MHSSQLGPRWPLLSLALLVAAAVASPVRLAAVEAWNATHVLTPPQADHYPPGLNGGCSISLMCSGPSKVADRVITIHDPPAHGRAEPWGNGTKWLEFHPDPGFTGTDSFTWSVTGPDGSSEIVTATIDLRHWNDRERLLVDLVIRPDLLAATGIEERIERLAADIRADGFRCRITPWSANAADLWQHFHDSFRAGADPANPVLHGAILFGDIPKLGDYDLFYSLLDERRSASDSTIGTHYFRQIWVSRFADRDPQRLRNALDANHRYRHGISRLPASAWDAIDHEEWSVEFQAEAIGQVWPDLRANSDPNSGTIMEAMLGGGEYVFRADHNAPRMPDGPYQIRFAFVSGCESMSSSTGPHTYQGTAGGGNLFSVGSNENTPSYTFNIGSVLQDRWHNDLQRWLPAIGIPMLNGGASWGQLLQAGGFERGHFHATRCHLFGDPTLAVKQTPANALPEISLMTDPASAMAGEVITMTATVVDTDAHTSDSPYQDFEHRIEWYRDGYDRYGSIPPTFISEDQDSDWRRYSVTYDRPHRYQLRAEVVDEWLGRGWDYRVIAIRPEPDEALRIDTGQYNEVADESLDWRDSQDRLWLHDQDQQAGTWGTAGDRKYRSASSSTEVLDTDEDRLYRRARRIRSKAVSWAVPLADGTYTVVLHFADVFGIGAGRAAIDISIEGDLVLAGFDAPTTFGADRAGQRRLVVTVSDGQLDLRLQRSDSATTDGFLNALEILPGADNLPPVARAGSDRQLPADSAGEASISLDGRSSSDADGSIVDWHWLLDGNPLAASATANLRLPIGDHLLRLRVVDDDGAAASDFLRVQVDPPTGNAPPTWDRAPSFDPAVAIRTQAELDAAAVDPEGEPVAYRWTLEQAPAGASPTFASEQARTLVTFDQSGSYRFRCRASDPSGAWVEGVVDLVIEQQPTDLQILP